MTKFFIFVAIIGTPIMLINAAYTSTNYWHQANDTFFLRNYPNSIELMNLGNSHERLSLYYEPSFEGVAHNFAADSQSPRYSYYMLEERSHALSPGAVVLIPISFFDFETDFVELYSGGNKAYNTRYYPVMKEKKHIVSYSLEDDLLYHYLPILTAKDNLRYIIDDIALPEAHGGSYESVGTESALDEIASNKAKDWELHIMVDGSNEGLIEETTKENMFWFQKTIDYCHENGLTPILISSPVTDGLLKKLPHERIDRFDSNMKILLEKNPDILWLDYSRDSRFVDNLGFFEDSDHLNAIGGSLYTRQLLLDLVDHGFISYDDLSFTEGDVEEEYARSY